MDLKKLNPWNWFRHEEKERAEAAIPVRMPQNVGRSDSGRSPELHPVLRMHQEMNRLFDEMFQSFSGFGGSALFDRSRQAGDMWGGFRPSIDVSGDNERYEIALDVPGYNESELDITLQEDVLIIQGKKQTEQTKEDKHYYRVERQYGEFRRVLNLPADAASDAIQAKLKNGVLHLELPRKVLPQPAGKRIEIEP